MPSTPLPSTFSEWFGLKDPDRKRFTLRPERDHSYMVDYGGLIEKAEAQLAKYNGKGIWEGDYGSGKTLLLRHLEHEVAPRFGYRPIYIVLANLDRKSNFYSVHFHFMHALLPVLKSWNQRDLEELDTKEYNFCPDLIKAMRDYVGHGLGNMDSKKDAEAWLLGIGLTPSRAHRAGYVGLLRERLPIDELVKYYRAISKVATKKDGTKLLFLLDEADAFRAVASVKAEDGSRSISNGFRSLFDPDNAELGLIIGLAKNNNHLNPILKADVYRRVEDLWHTLPGISSSNCAMFIEKLWSNLSKTPSMRPFRLDQEVLKRFIGLDPTLTLLISDPRRSHRRSWSPDDVCRMLDKIGQTSYERQIEVVGWETIRELSSTVVEDGER